MGLSRYSTRLTKSKFIVRTDCSPRTRWVVGASNISQHSSDLITRAASTWSTTWACRMSTSDQWNRNYNWNEHVACWNRVGRVSLEEREPRVNPSQSPHVRHFRSCSSEWFSPSLACLFILQEIPTSRLCGKRLFYNRVDAEIRGKQSMEISYFLFCSR